MSKITNNNTTIQGGFCMSNHSRIHGFGLQESKPINSSMKVNLKNNELIFRTTDGTNTIIELSTGNFEKIIKANELKKIRLWLKK